MSELVLEFPNLSWKHWDASESDIREEERDVWKDFLFPTSART